MISRLLHDNLYQTNVVYKFNVSDPERCLSLIHWYIHGLRDRDIDSTFAAKFGFVVNSGYAVDLRYKPEGRGIDSVNGIFQLFNSSGHTMALRSTQPLTEMSTRNISWG
jgi:hypothetical protein